MDGTVTFVVLGVTMTAVVAMMALVTITTTVNSTGRTARIARCECVFVVRLSVSVVRPDRSHRKLVSGRIIVEVVVVTLVVVLTVSVPVVIVEMMVGYGARDVGHRSGKARCRAVQVWFGG